MSELRHGSQRAYVSDGCHCPVCRAGNTTRHRDLRKTRFSKRVLVGGRLIAPVPTERHALMTTYNNWGCRCWPCTKAASAYKVAARRKAGTPQTDDAREEER